mgnify:CR=1 FL=1
MLHDLGLDENGSVANPFRQDWRGPGARAHAGAVMLPLRPPCLLPPSLSASLAMADTRIVAALAAL